MKYLNKIFSLGLASLAFSPVMTGCTATNTNKIIWLNSNRNETNEKDLRCTVAYVGKNCAKDGLAMIARTNDSTPRASHSYLKKVEHNEIANTVLKNNFGFEYKMPSETYAYVSSPDSWKTNPKDERHLWQSMGINEMGVGNTCTLTCFANDKATAADPHLESGIAEEAFNQIIAAQADSAKKAMQVVADIVDKQGSQDANLILVTDQNETWLMELYTGHEYCAVKLPDDKVMVAGNEFILNTLADLGISEATKENCILSPRLLSLPVEKGFAKFDDSGIEDIYHLHLYNTYAGGAEQGTFTDGCHMRTWRGYSLWDPSGDIAQSYGAQTKYPPLFTPKDANGNVRTDMTIYDVIQVYRDEYDELIGKPGFEAFTEAKAAGTLRTIATETARLVHIITSNPNLPKEIACNALYCPSSANYTPFLLLNNGINSFGDQYSYEPTNWVYDENCASVVYRKINSIAWPYREKYGIPLQNLWRIFEYIYITQMEQVINDASQLPLSDAKTIITNFNNHERENYYDTVKNVGIDLLWHDMNQDHRTEGKILKFAPLIDIEQYLSVLGWTNFKKDGKNMTFRYANATSGKIDVGEGYTGERGKLYINDVETNIDVAVRDDRIFVGFDELNTAIGDKHSIVKVNIDDYRGKSSTANLAWILPLAIGLPLVAIGATVAIVILKRKKTIQNNND